MKKLYNKTYYLNCKLVQLRKSRLNPFIDEVMKLKPKRVLDVGCGLGKMVTCLRELGVDAWGVDWAQTLKDDFGMKEKHFVIADAQKLPFPDNSFDVVISTDFFEHLQEEDVGTVFKEMRRVGGIVMAHVAYKDVLNSRQMKLHPTNKPVEWWEEKLKGAILL